MGSRVMSPGAQVLRPHTGPDRGFYGFILTTPSFRLFFYFIQKCNVYTKIYAVSL